MITRIMLRRKGRTFVRFVASTGKILHFHLLTYVDSYYCCTSVVFTNDYKLKRSGIEFHKKMKTVTHQGRRKRRRHAHSSNKLFARTKVVGVMATANGHTIDNVIGTLNRHLRLFTFSHNSVIKIATMENMFVFVNGFIAFILAVTTLRRQGVKRFSAPWRELACNSGVHVRIRSQEHVHNKDSTLEPHQKPL